MLALCGIRHRVFGYTLLELMITVAILGIVASIAVPAWSGYTAEAHQTSAMTRVSVISMALEEFHAENRTYETNLEALRIAATDEWYAYNISQGDVVGYRVEAIPLDSRLDLRALSLDHLGRRQYRIGGADEWHDGWP